MKHDKNEVIKFIEPVLGFCIKRLSNRYDAEDLASEIMLYVLDGLDKYAITSLEAWVWRIAHNRYARFVKKRNQDLEIYSDEVLFDCEEDYSFINELMLKSECRQIFKMLHTLSSEYKDILVDYYIGEMSVKRISAKYALTESTVKWRLNISREKIKDRMGENDLNMVYKRINWNTAACNGSMNSNKYLHSQVARAVCEAACEKPMTVEELSMATGLPTMYVEDELPRLIGGDAIVQTGNKYAADFIILRMCDKLRMNNEFYPHLQEIADYFYNLLVSKESAIKAMEFYGAEFGLKRLGYIIIPAILRNKIRQIKDSLNIPDGPFTPRKDGGYGWFIVEETETADEIVGKYASGCNATDEENGNIYYYLIQQYFCNNIYHNGGTRWLAANKIPQKCINGIIPDGLLTEDDTVRLLSVNLIEKSSNGYILNFAIFTQDEYSEFISLFTGDDEEIDRYLSELIRTIHKSFKSFVPKRLDSQINQWVSCYIHGISAMVCEQLISKGLLEKPEQDKPLTDGVFYVSGKYINP